jgi:ATP-dependent helicase HrpB
MTPPVDTAGEWRPATRLPVDEALPALRAALTNGTSAVLQAPPGAGKTTHVPLALVNEPWLAGSRIVMLEPRRLAARAVTHRMAQLLGERAGDTVGYRVRRDTRTGPKTRIEVVTEGILTRMLQSDATLEGVGLLIFDEFHERSIHADTGLALALHSRSLVRPDLRILVMSATLDGARVAALLDDAPVIASEGRLFPVALSYSARPDSRGLAAAIASRIVSALDENDDGDVLAFLPGGAEIRRVAMLLDGRVSHNVRVERLYGDLSQQSQDAAIAPAPKGLRKVVLSTPISETSLTIEGVRIVIDSGLARAPRFSPRSGMTRLETVRISRSSADQRAGRAGRTAPGKCYRLWAEHEQYHLLEHASPEILQADLAPLVLELAVAGIRSVDELRWLDAPPRPALEQGAQLLKMLGALDPDGAVTDHGRAIAALPVHPRIAHMLIRSVPIGAGAMACDIAAMLGERDFVRGINGPADADIAIRLELLHARSKAAALHGAQIDTGLLQRVAAESAALRRQLRIPNDPATGASSAGAVLALAYPDRIGQARGDAKDGRFLLRNGRGAALTHPQGLSTAEYIVAAELDGDARSSRVFLGAALTQSEIDAQLADQMEIEEILEWDTRTRSVRARMRTRLGAITLSESTVSARGMEGATDLMLDVVRREGIQALPWSDAGKNTRERVAFVRARHSDWPDLSDESLMATLGEWLAPLLEGRTSIRELSNELDRALMAMLDWRQRADLDRLAPLQYVAPTGTHVAIDYSNPAAPSISVRLQEMFGVRQTPTVDAGSVPLTLELLSPARRAVQVTRDLEGFWRGSYFEVRKQLRGRYPKHVWPEDPLTAPPTARAKRRGE